jgi:hypothetical protein
LKQKHSKKSWRSAIASNEVPVISSYHAMIVSTTSVPGMALLGAGFAITPLPFWVQGSIFVMICMIAGLLFWSTSPSADPRELGIMDQLGQKAMLGPFLVLVVFVVALLVGGRAGTSLMFSTLASTAFVRLSLRILTNNLKAVTGQRSE